MNVGLHALTERHGSDGWLALSVEDGPALTYGELRAMRDRFASGLVAAGIHKGDRVALMLYNSTEYWGAYLAIARIGAVCVRLNFRLTSREVAYVLDDAGCAALIFHDTLASTLEPIQDYLPDGRTFAMPWSGEAVPSWAKSTNVLGSHAIELPHVHLDEEDPVMIMYTSGTTGAPKGAVWTHESTLWFGLMQGLQWPFGRSTVSLTTGPLYHVGSMEDLLLPTLMNGGRAIVTRSGDFSLERVLGITEKLEVTDALFFPSMIYELLSKRLYEAYDLSRLRRVLTGGSPLQPRAVKEWLARLPHVELFPVYGLTEGGGISTVLEPTELDSNPSAAGRPMPLAAIRIEAPDRREAPPGEVGEILVSGPNVANGYWNRPLETQDTFVQGWCRTGDLGLVTHAGLLYVKGRKKDMIRSGDENVYAAEVEAVIVDHPDVEDVAVIGIPDREYGEAVCAVVVVRGGARLEAMDITSHAREQLASYKKPRHVIFVDELPRNATNKVVKRELRERYASLGDEPGVSVSSTDA